MGSPSEGPWRLLLMEGSPERLLAMDDALARSVGSGSSPSTLKLASFPRPTVSVGFFRRGGDVDLSACESEGIPVLRRPSGGGSVLHFGGWDVTYCIATRLPLGVCEAYGLLCSPLLSSLSAMGLEPRMNRSGDVLLGRRKVAGAAQLRRGGALVLHGYLMVSTDLDLLYRVLHKPPGKLSAKGLDAPRWATTLRAEGIRSDVGAFRDRIIRSYGDALGSSLLPSDPSPDEERSCSELIKRYTDGGWSVLRGSGSPSRS